MSRHLLFVMTLFTVLTTASATNIHAENIIKIIEPVWNELTIDERSYLADRYDVKVVSAANIGQIIDVQTVNMSSPGNNAGSAIGAAAGRAVYLDQAAQNPSSYSAKKDLAATVTGALIGGLANTPPKSEFKIRYSIRMMDGKINYRDFTQDNPLRLSVGECYSLSGALGDDQTLCTQTPDKIRTVYLKTENSPELTKTESHPGKVQCRFGRSSPVWVTSDICIKAQGEITNAQ